MTSEQHPSVLTSLGEIIRSELQQKLSDKAQIHLSFDEDRTEFDKADLRFTQYERPTYLAIISPGCEDDVAKIVKYARTKGIPFTPRGGHHAVTSTMRHFQNGICINMRPLNQMRWNAEKRQVTTGGGAITDEFVHFVHDLGMEVSKYDRLFDYRVSANDVCRCRVVSYNWHYWCSVRRRPGTTTRQVWLSA
jgi:hypothetical protein